MPFIKGIIKDESGSLVARTIRIYDRATGDLIRDMISDATTGEYIAYIPTTDEVHCVILDDATEAPLRNDIAIRLIPEPIIGLPAWNLFTSEGLAEWMADEYVGSTEIDFTYIKGISSGNVETLTTITQTERSVSGKILGFPYYHENGFTLVDAETEEVTLFGTFSVDDPRFMDSFMGPKGTIFGHQAYADNMVEINPDTQAINYTIPCGKNSGSLYAPAGFCMAANGKAYSPPRTDDYPFIIEFDPITLETFFLITPLDVDGVYPYSTFINLPNGNLYAPAGYAANSFIFDPFNITVEYLATGTPTDLTSYYHPILAPNGKVYSRPSDSTLGWLEFDPDTKAELDVGVVKGDEYIFGAPGLVLPDGCIYYIPSIYDEPHATIKFDPETYLWEALPLFFNSEVKVSAFAHGSQIKGINASVNLYGITTNFTKDDSYTFENDFLLNKAVNN